MKIIEHTIEHNSRHSANSIWELVDDGVALINAEKLIGYTSAGFYYVDETESNVVGPFASIHTAVLARNSYYATL